MKLKEIVENIQDREALFQRLDDEFSKDYFIFQRPYVYRGTNRDSEPIQRKDVSSRKERDPRDTQDIADEVIHVFYKQCYPTYPKRRESIFCTSSPSYASNFGNVYAVFPGRFARMAYRPRDPHDLLLNIGDDLDLIKRLWEGHSKAISEGFKDLSGSVANRIQYITSFLATKDMRFEGNNLSCPHDMYQEVKSYLEKHREKLEDEYLALEELLNVSRIALRRTGKYFNSFEQGYPELNENPGEFMVDGEYLQVKKEVFDEYLEWKEDDLHKVRTDV